LQAQAPLNSPAALMRALKFWAVRALVLIFEPVRKDLLNFETVPMTFCFVVNIDN
jgi:hypothetical protein